MSQQSDSDDELGGEEVCWLPRVCPHCGRLSDREPPTTCEQCGELIERV